MSRRRSPCSICGKLTRAGSRCELHTIPVGCRADGEDFIFSVASGEGVLHGHPGGTCPLDQEAAEAIVWEHAGDLCPDCREPPP